jgi:UDP-glucose 6-dehydrogenase
MVLIGGEDANTIDRYQQVYHKIQTQRPPNIHAMSLTAAEIVKIGINCYLTTKISYANMLGQVLLRSGLGQDVDKALAAVGADSRVGNKYLKFGYGFGGPCLPRDNRSFGHYARRLGLKFNLGETVDAFNSEHAEFLFQQYKKLNPDRLPYYMPYISYKVNTDIFEESQQLRLCLNLLEDGYHVIIEPSDLIPRDILAHLVNIYSDRVSFVRQQELDEKNQRYIQVMA